MTRKKTSASSPRRSPPSSGGRRGGKQLTQRNSPPRGDARTGRGAASAAILQHVFARTRTDHIRRYIQDLLTELCRINTTPHPDVAKMRTAEERCFRILERELGKLQFSGAQIQRRPINPAIQSHPSYSLPHFTRTGGRPQGLSAEQTYAGRSNLLYLLPAGTEQVHPPRSRACESAAPVARQTAALSKPAGLAQPAALLQARLRGTQARLREMGASVAINGHIDVVAPYFPPHARRGIVFGRGACDDKGPVVGMMAALKVLSEVMAEGGLRWNRDVTAMFVVEEETGGNGSLSLAIDRDLKRHYDCVLVTEPTQLKIHPANRGAVWYQAELKPPAGVSAFEMFAFVNEELEKEGAAIRAESHHDLFPQRPVQTCHGVIGPFGEHPSRICGEVSFAIQFRRRPDQPAEVLVRDCLESGLAGYLGLYGDKSKVTDPATGKPMVARHYDVRRAGNRIEVAVHGATGHMGAIRERDGAITKMAHLVRSLVASRKRLEAIGGPLRLVLGTTPGNAHQRKPSDRETLVLEGGQGFVPTHSIEEVMDRLRRAAERGAAGCLARCGHAEFAGATVSVSYEKLHNAAFDGDPDSPAMRDAIAAAKACGLWKDARTEESQSGITNTVGTRCRASGPTGRSAPPGSGKDEPIRGWTVSCDARLFAVEYPGMPVLTFGPGNLAFAHSDQEQITVDEIQKAAEFLAVFLLRHTGTIRV